MPPTSQIEVTTLGTRHGAPPPGDALLVDLSHRLRNPAHDPALRGLTGLDPALRAHVLATPGAEEIVRITVEQALALLPYQQGPVRLRVQCRWGRHRSVALAEEVVDRLRAKGVTVQVAHRDVSRDALRRQDGCAFCDIVHGQAAAEVVQEWDDVIAIRPRSGGVNDGHVLFLPRDHVADAASHPETTARVMAAAAEYAVGGDLNIITSKGADATQTVFHLHIHVVPRRPGDRLRLPWTPSWFDRLISLVRIFIREFTQARTFTQARLLDGHAQVEETTPTGHGEDPVITLGDRGTDGWWDGMTAFGPGYTPGLVQVRTTIEPWPHPETRTVATCPRCEATNGLSLVWPDARPDLAHLMCPWCHIAWPDPVWSGPGAVRWVLDRPITGGPGAREDADAAPEVAYLTEYLRRMAGNTPQERP